MIYCDKHIVSAVRWFSFFAAVVLLVAIGDSFGGGDLPYGYFTFLRIVECAYFGLIAFMLFAEDKPVACVPHAVLAVLYNPLIKISLARDVWVVVNMGCLVAILCVYLIVRVERSQTS